MAIDALGTRKRATISKVEMTNRDEFIFSTSDRNRCNVEPGSNFSSASKSKQSRNNFHRSKFVTLD